MWSDCARICESSGTSASRRRNHVIPIWQKEQGGKRPDGAYPKTPGCTNRARIRLLHTHSQWFEAKRTRGWDTVSNARCQPVRQFDRKWKYTKSGAWTRSTRTTRLRFIGMSSFISRRLSQPAGIIRGRRFWDFVVIVKMNADSVPE